MAAVLEAGPHQAPERVNAVPASERRVRAVCAACGCQSAPVLPSPDGEPAILLLADGWSVAPFPVGYRHADGSSGSRFSCPGCSQSRAGQQARRKVPAV